MPAATSVSAAAGTMTAPVARPVAAAVPGAMSRGPVVDVTVDMDVPIDVNVPINMHVAIDVNAAVIPVMPAGAAAPADSAIPRETAPVPARASPG